MISMRALPIAVLFALAWAGSASAQMSGSGDRAGHWEFYGGLRPMFGESVDLSGGGSLDVDDDLGFAFGGGYNFSDNLLVSGEFSWGSPDYDGQVEFPEDDLSTISGELDVAAISASATWHFMEGPLTPYVSGTLGYTWVDTNIATGPPITGCWWDPWWGYVCDTWVDTKDEEAVSYGLGVGVRWDFARGWFARLSYDERWTDLDGTSGTPSFGGLHIDIGGKY